MKLYPDPIESAYSWYGNNHNTAGTREWTAEKVSGKPNLVICIGDSWTWGDSLGNSQDEPALNDVDARHSQFYTNLLAEKLQADWLMIAWCGGTNDWILHQYSVIKTAIDKGLYRNYSKVYVHVCLTEMFRDLRDLRDHDYFQPSNKENFLEFSKEYFKRFVLDKLKENMPIPNTHSFSKNFWNVDYDVSGYNFVKDTWQDVLFKQNNIEKKKTCPVVSGIGITPLVTYLKKNKFEKIEAQFSDVLLDIDGYIDAMNKCKFNNEYATKHPTAEGHRLWADYLAESFTA
tara:strand:+ start:770 stop:1633 length:864 start_codon:yes stop_codon:yes gene_type:complete